MTTKRLKDLKLSTEMMIASDIQLELQGKLNTCNEGCTTFDDTAIALGEDNKTGSMAAAILSIDTKNNVIYTEKTSSISLHIDELVGANYSARVSNNYDYCGKILTITENGDNLAISCTDVPRFQGKIKETEICSTYVYPSNYKIDGTTLSIDVGNEKKVKYYDRACDTWKNGDIFCACIKSEDRANTSNPQSYIGVIRNITFKELEPETPTTYKRGRISFALDDADPDFPSKLKSGNVDFVSIVQTDMTTIPLERRQRLTTLWFPGHQEIGDFSRAQYGMSIGGGNKSEGNYSFVIGVNNDAAGNYSFVQGMNSQAGYNSVAFGNNVRAYGMNDFAAGQNIQLSSTSTFVWNGSNSNVSVNRQGTFNVFPIGGTDGVYISNKPLTQYLTECSDKQSAAYYQGNISKDIKEKSVEVMLSCLETSSLSGEWKEITDDPTLSVSIDTWITANGTIASKVGAKTTGYLTLSQIDGLRMNSKVQWGAVCIVVYDEQQKVLGYVGIGEDNQPFEMKDKILSATEIYRQFKNAVYVRLSSYHIPLKVEKLEIKPLIQLDKIRNTKWDFSSTGKKSMNEMFQDLLKYLGVPEENIIN